MTPVFSYLVVVGWHGASATKVLTVGMTPKRFRIRAITRTRLAGRNRWLEPGEEALVPKTAVRHGDWSSPVAEGQFGKVAAVQDEPAGATEIEASGDEKGGDR